MGGVSGRGADLAEEAGALLALDLPRSVPGGALLLSGLLGQTLVLAACLASEALNAVNCVLDFLLACQSYHLLLPVQAIVALTRRGFPAWCPDEG